jgi:hypothetical protein
MNYETLNRAQLLLKLASMMEKRANKGILNAAKEVALGVGKAGKDVGKAALHGVGEGAKHLDAAGHPILALGLKASPYVGAGVVGKGALDKYRQWQLQRLYRQQTQGY